MFTILRKFIINYEHNFCATLCLYNKLFDIVLMERKLSVRNQSFKNIFKSTSLLDIERELGETTLKSINF